MSIHRNLPRDLLVTLVETIGNDNKEKLEQTLEDNKSIQRILFSQKLLLQYTCCDCKKWAKLLFNHCRFSDSNEWVQYKNLSDLYKPYADKIILTCQYCNRHVCKACSVIHRATPYNVLCIKCDYRKLE